ncbi:putative polyketide synthase [Coniochaeta ligniaria NRRL 30616]|uniref:Putative polyketide synthase n=1 Tax=Coniochaeta ligniaria NRRL 30616 TaxID=1408157 RepID=A0A1J7IV72_9PEZI|nr:putative polyketide synthase [Coniochaeta ligniaria NRRL 30616]
MPGRLRTSRSSSEHSDGTHPSSVSSTFDDYPALSFPGYAEKPLKDQLEPIAVCGMGCRLPGDVASPSAFWDMLISKGTGNTPKVPADRFNIDAYIHKNNDRPGSFGVLGGYFINEDLGNFDPAFFNITPIEAMWMDPQQRKLLEVCYESLESAGVSLEAISGTRTAVFAASFTADWQQMSFKEPSFRHSLSATGVDPGIISNRISHIFNLNGPSIVVNTACSSSVYALHNACNALRNNECEGALVGGVNLIITVDQHMNTAKLGVLSPTSTCHTFDETADGYGRADAVGAVYLKRLSDAVRDGDPIRGVIRSSAVNSNGKVPAVGITHPNREGQADVIAQAYKRGGDLDPRLTGYFECHGTGTAIGDPLEVHAVSVAMNKERDPAEDDPLWIGAVKTNIGHSEAASGLSALIKAILIVERGVIPPTRGLVKPNPKISWKDWQVRVVTEPVSFPHHLPVRRVSINSFGYGGTNAHLIVEGADSLVRTPQAYTFVDSNTPRKLLSPRRALERRRPFLLPFSAHDKATLKRNIDAHAAVVDRYSLHDLSYTLANRRSNLSSRAFTVASHATVGSVFGDAARTAFSFADKKKTPTVGFVFTGQGAQWPRMGAELMEQYPSFLRSIRLLDHALGDLPDGPDWSIEDVLLDGPETSRVNEAEFSQPLCTAVQVAMVQLLASWGVRPVVTVGHSSGEMAAAYAAGLLSAKQAIVAAYYRGKVVKDVNTGGAMMAVGLGAEAVAPYLADVSDKVVVACHNSPAGVTLSGDADALATVQAKLDAESIFARQVKTNGKAYHSHHMVPVADKYEKLVRAASTHIAFDLPLETEARMVSSVTNAVLPAGTILNEAYWSANLRSPVLFNQAVQTILTSDEFSHVDLLIEVGPHSAMAGPIKQIKAELKAEKLDYLPTLLRGQDSAVQLLKTAGELFLRNYRLDMGQVTWVETPAALGGGKATGTQGHTIVDLPPYQWNYAKPLWAESRASREQRLPPFPRHDVLGQLVIGSSLSEPTWRNVLRARDLPWLKHHFLGGESVFPAAGYFSMAIEAITQLHELADKPASDIAAYVLRDVTIQKALVTPDNDDGVEVMLNMRRSTLDGAKWWDFGVSSVDGEGVQKEHMTGSISIRTGGAGAGAADKPKPRAVPDFPQRATGKAWNQALRQVGFDYGPTFQDMDDVRFDGKRYEAGCRTNVKQSVMDESLGESRYVLHPASVDSTLQLCIAAIYAGRTTAMDCGVVPVQMDEMTIWPPTGEQVAARRASAYAWVDRRGMRTCETSVQMVADDGEMVMEIVKVRTTSYEAAVPQKLQADLEEAPYGEMKWDLDIDGLEAGAPVDDAMTVTRLANLALFKRPDTKVLHVGPSSVSDAIQVLRENPRASYTIALSTDEEVEAAQGLLSEYPKAEAVNLSLADDLEEQGFKPESYDLLIVAGQEAPATETLATLRRLVKDGGRAIWEFAGKAPAGDVLTAAGFGGIDFASTSKTGSTVALLSTAAATTEQQSDHVRAAIQLVYRNKPGDVFHQVKLSLERLGCSVDVCNLAACRDAKPKEHVIMLSDLEDSALLSTLTETDLAAIQSITNSASTLLWVTAGGLLEGKKPEHAMVSGLARSVRSEQVSLDFRTLDLDLETIRPSEVPGAIVKVAKLQLSEEDGPEREFCVSGSNTYISRLVRTPLLNNIFSASQNTKDKRFAPGDRISGRVHQGKIVFQEQAGEDEMRPGHVEVQARCAALSKEGVLVITGADYPTTFSHAVGGIVTRVGSGVTSHQVGDRVVGFHADKFASFQQIPASMATKIESSDDMEASVGMLMAYMAALYGLETLAAIKPGDNVLILHGTGSVGTAAVRLAQMSGATPFVVVNSEAEAEFLTSNLGLAEANTIRLSDGTSVAQRLANLTNGRGADIVLSAGHVDPGAAREAWRHIARFGRFVDAGRKHVLSRSALDTVPVARGASYLSFDLLELHERRPETLAAMMPRIVQMARQGHLVAPGSATYVNLADINSAVASFSDDFGAPSTVVVYEPSETPIQVLSSRAPARFSPDATYLLVGCLGGLGRSLTSWMMEAGTRRFTFLSRSGTDNKSAAKLVADIEAAGAIVQVVRGDATSRSDVVRAVQGVSSKHPIRGVVHAAMVLRDGLFHSMPFADWKTSVEPKIVGAVNLHSVLSRVPLDFFIMTSSVSGVLGTPGQSNYAAANSYLDSLARYRRRAAAQGDNNSQTAISLVLPMVLGVGVVAENADLEDALTRKGMYGIDEEHLLQAFEAAVTASSSADSDHIVVGLDPSKLQRAINSNDSGSGDMDCFWLSDARFSHAAHDIRSNDSSAGTGGNSGQSILATIKAAASPTEAADAVTAHFVDKLSRMLMLGPGEFDEVGTRSIADYGVDSMVGAELRNWIFVEYRMDVPFQRLLGPALTVPRFAAQVCAAHGVGGEA